jgi:hypothetical protein
MISFASHIHCYIWSFYMLNCNGISKLALLEFAGINTLRKLGLLLTMS